MNCKDCIYLGRVFEHLKGFDGTDEWRHCNYPLPFYVTPKAVPIIEKHECKVYKESEDESKR